MQEQHHYVQPHNAHEAMVLIQKLFNEYRHAPLTDVLLKYHNNLVNRLMSDIHDAAVKEGNPEQLHDLDNMIKVMQLWTKMRLANRPFDGKMKNFKWVTNRHPKYKRHIHKMNGSANHRASRH